MKKSKRVSFQIKTSLAIGTLSSVMVLSGCGERIDEYSPVMWQQDRYVSMMECMKDWNDEKLCEPERKEVAENTNNSGGTHTAGGFIGPRYHYFYEPNSGALMRGGLAQSGEAITRSGASAFYNQRNQLGFADVAEASNKVYSSNPRSSSSLTHSQQSAFKGSATARSSSSVARSGFGGTGRGFSMGG